MLKYAHKLIAGAFLAIGLTACGGGDEAEAPVTQQDTAPVAAPVATAGAGANSAAFAQELVDVCIKTGADKDKISTLLASKGASRTDEPEDGPIWTYNLAGQDVTVGSNIKIKSCGMLLANVDADKALSRITELTGATLHSDRNQNGQRERSYVLTQDNNRYMIAAIDPKAQGELFSAVVGAIPTR